MGTELLYSYIHGLTDNEKPIELELETTTPHERAKELPKKVFFGCQIFETLRSSLIMTDCNETRLYFKYPLRNATQDTIDWEDPDAVNVFVAPDGSRPEADFTQFNPEYFASILRKCLLKHPEETPRHNIVITYPGRLDPVRQENIVSAVRNLQMFPVEPTGVTCLSEAQLYHSIFHRDKQAIGTDDEIPIVLYADYQTSWMSVNIKNFVFIGDGEHDINNAELCSGRVFAKAALEKYQKYRTDEQFSFSLAEKIKEFEAVAFKVFDTQNPDEFQRKAEADPTLLSKLAEQLPTRLEMEKNIDVISHRAFLELRKNINEFLKKRFGSQGCNKIHIICCGPMFTRNDNYHRFRFFKELKDGCTRDGETYKLDVKWQCNRSGALNRIDVAAACYAALHDKVDPLYCETANREDLVFERKDLAVVLTAPLLRNLTVAA